MRTCETISDELNSSTEDYNLYYYLKDAKFKKLKNKVTLLENELLISLFKEHPSLLSFEIKSGHCGDTLLINEDEIPLNFQGNDFRSYLVEFDVTINQFRTLTYAIKLLRKRISNNKHLRDHYIKKDHRSGL